MNIINFAGLLLIVVSSWLSIKHKIETKGDNTIQIGSLKVASRNKGLILIITGAILLCVPYLINFISKDNYQTININNSTINTTINKPEPQLLNKEEIMIEVFKKALSNANGPIFLVDGQPTTTDTSKLETVKNKDGIVLVKSISDTYHTSITATWAPKLKDNVLTFTLNNWSLSKRLIFNREYNLQSIKE